MHTMCEALNPWRVSFLTLLGLMLRPQRGFCKPPARQGHLLASQAHVTYWVLEAPRIEC